MDTKKPGEEPGLPKRPDDKMLAKNRFQDLLIFLKDSANNDTVLYAKNLDPRSNHFNEPYAIYLTQSGTIECRSVNKPPHTVILNPQIAQANHLFLTDETFDILTRYKEKQDGNRRKAEIEAEVRATRRRLRGF